MKEKKFKFNSSIIFRLLVSLLFAVTAFLDSVLTYKDDIFARPEELHFNPYTQKSYILFAVVFVAGFVVLTIIYFLQKKINIHYEPEAKKASVGDYLIWLLVFVLLACAWLPYILSYFPGGVYPDTATSIGQARFGTYNNQQPILYALIFKLSIMLAGELYAVMAFSIFQAVFTGLCISYIVFRLRLHKVSKAAVILLFIYYAAFTLVPLYVVSIWKDTLFSTVLLMFIFSLTESVILSGRKPTVFETVKIIFWMILSVFLRNNGIYVMILTFIALLLSFGKLVFKTHKGFFISMLLAIIACFAVQGPVFSMYGLNGPFVENLGVLQQQIAYVQVIGGDMTDEQAQFLEKICPAYVIQANYRPLDVDTIKWHEQYDNEFLEANKAEFIKTWACMIKDNPKLYADAYLYITLGFWNPFKQSSVSYVNPEMWGDLKGEDRYWQSDMVEYYTGSSIREYLTPKTLISSAAFLFITLVLFVLSINKKNKSALAFIPALGVYLTVFIATPLAFALRYVYIVVLTVPLYLIIAFLNTGYDTEISPKTGKSGKTKSTPSDKSNNSDNLKDNSKTEV